MHIIVVELLAPQHAGQGLAHDIGLVRRERGRNDAGVKVVSVLAASLERCLERTLERPSRLAVALRWGAWRDITEPQTHDLRGPGVNGQAVMRRDLGPLLRGVHR